MSVTGLAASRLFAIFGLSCSVFFAAGTGVWLDVPFVEQSKDGCGAASVAMLMRYWQQAGPAALPSLREIEKSLDRVPREHGVRAADLERYLQKQGFRTFVSRGEWSDLEHHLRLGRPLVVALKPGGSGLLPIGDLHYVVVTGIDTAQGIAFKNDPAVRKLLKQRRPDFEREWRAAGNWMLLAVPEQGAPSSSTVP